MTLELDLQASLALDYANEVIAKYGGNPQPKLHRGVPGHAMRCSLARTIQTGIAGSSVSVQPADRSVMVLPTPEASPEVLPLPKAVAEFAVAFDEGQYSDLKPFPVIRGGRA